MSTRRTIIEQIKKDVEDNVSSANGYNSDIVNVRIGVYDPSEFTQLPSIGFLIIEDEIIDDMMDDSILRKLNMICYMYADSDGYDSYLVLYNLFDDIEKFLYSTDWTFNSGTQLGRLIISYGGVETQVGMGVLNFQITYEQTNFSS